MSSEMAVLTTSRAYLYVRHVCRGPLGLRRQKSMSWLVVKMRRASDGDGVQRGRYRVVQRALWLTYPLQASLCLALHLSASSILRPRP